MSAPLALTASLAAIPAAIGAISAFTSYRGWSGQLTRSGRLGVRSTAALTSEAAFTTANRVAAPIVAGSALIGLAIAAGVIFIPFEVSTAIIVAVIGTIAAIALLVYAGLLGDRAAQVVPRPATKPGGGAGCGGCACGSGGCGSGLTRDTSEAASGS